VDVVFGDKYSTRRGIDPVIVTLTTGRMILSGTNSPPAQVSITGSIALLVDY
jgi:hypothetical protein